MACKTDTACHSSCAEVTHVKSGGETSLRCDDTPLENTKTSLIHSACCALRASGFTPTSLLNHDPFGVCMCVCIYLCVCVERSYFGTLCRIRQTNTHTLAHNIFMCTRRKRLKRLRALNDDVVAVATRSVRINV